MKWRQPLLRAIHFNDKLTNGNDGEETGAYETEERKEERRDGAALFFTSSTVSTTLFEYVDHVHRHTASND